MSSALFLLGIIQGLTEFLPVSSSGHLELAKALIGADILPQESLLFTVALHGATALSTLVVFRKDIGIILSDLVKLKPTPFILLFALYCFIHVACRHGGSLYGRNYHEPFRSEYTLSRPNALAHRTSPFFS